MTYRTIGTVLKEKTYYHILVIILVCGVWINLHYIGMSLAKSSYLLVLVLIGAAGVAAAGGGSSS